jgi:endonuclease YncB( thermonuclease family)/dienelactone hydrolase
MAHAGWSARLVLALCLIMPCAASAQERATVPVTIDGETLQIATTTYKPAGAGPFPTLIFHRGTTDPSDPPAALARWFTDRGWAVVLPAAARSPSDGCEPAPALADAERALRDLDAVVPVLLAQPFVDRKRVAIGGHARGGALAVAWSGRQPKTVRAVVNFAGGWVSERCPSADEINQTVLRLGRDFDQPTAWLYSYRDPVYSMRHSRRNFAAFRAAGGLGEFHDLVVPEGLSGHRIDAVPGIWTAALEAYLAGRGLPAKPPVTFAEAIDGNTLKIDGKYYRLWGVDAPELDQRCYPEGWRAGFEAARALAAMVERWPVTCDPRSRDALGRTIALCRAAGRDLGAAMVLSGMALGTEGSDYADLEARAVRARTGMHAHACLAPSEWRSQRGLAN